MWTGGKGEGTEGAVFLCSPEAQEPAGKCFQKCFPGCPFGTKKCACGGPVWGHSPINYVWTVKLASCENRVMWARAHCCCVRFVWSGRKKSGVCAPEKSAPSFVFCYSAVSFLLGFAIVLSFLLWFSLICCCSLSFLWWELGRWPDPLVSTKSPVYVSRPLFVTLWDSKRWPQPDRCIVKINRGFFGLYNMGRVIVSTQVSR